MTGADDVVALDNAPPAELISAEHARSRTGGGVTRTGGLFVTSDQDPMAELLRVRRLAVRIAHEHGTTRTGLAT